MTRRPANPHPGEWLTMTEAAARLSIHVDAARDALRLGGVTIHKHKGTCYVTAVDLEVFAASYPKQSWTREEITTLRTLWGWRSTPDIAAVLERSETAVCIKAKRLKLRTVTTWPGVLTESSLAPLLAVDRSKADDLLRSGLFPTEILYKRSLPVRVVWEETLVRWLKRPSNWVYLPDIERIAHPPFVQAIAIGKHRWRDEWLTPGQVARMLGVDKRAVNKYVHRGSLTAVKYGNWRITRSSAEALQEKLNYHRQFAGAD